MKHILMYLRITPKVEIPIPETLVDEELVRLTKIVPRTKAEKQFHAWLVQWKEQMKIKERLKCR
jgi:hypothetical protein